jgi:hypothetical protein
VRCQIAQGHSYCSIRLDQSTWVVRNGRANLESTDLRIVPQFIRFRHVKKDDGRGFTCTCPFTSMCGLPCRHMAHVVQYHCKTGYIFTHQDFDMRRWTTYANFVAIMEPSASNGNEQTISERLLRIRRVVSLSIGDGTEMLDLSLQHLNMVMIRPRW